jgi:small subunit ribosomal protein S9
MSKTKVAQETNKVRAPNTTSNLPLSHGVGRRKKAVARVWVKRGTGLFVINGKKVNEYFDTEVTVRDAQIPFTLFPIAGSYDVHVNVVGGGLSAQAGATKLGLSRAFSLMVPEVRKSFKDEGLLTVDARNKERKKYGQKAARRKFQFVKR